MRTLKLHFPDDALPTLDTFLTLQRRLCFASVSSCSHLLPMYNKPPEAEQLPAVLARIRENDQFPGPLLIKVATPWVPPRGLRFETSSVSANRQDCRTVIVTWHVQSGSRAGPTGRDTCTCFGALNASTSYSLESRNFKKGNRSGGTGYATAGSSAWVSVSQGRSEGAGAPVYAA